MRIRTLRGRRALPRVSMITWVLLLWRGEGCIVDISDILTDSNIEK
jgi:hypothetical protein